MSQCPRDCINEEHCAKFPCLLGNNQPKHEGSRWFRRVAVGLVAVALLTLAGCSQSHEDKRGRGDAPVAGKAGDDSPAFCTNMPDEFANVCSKCLSGFPGKAVMSTTHTDNAAPAVTVFDAPNGMCNGVKVSATPSPSAGVKP